MDLPLSHRDAATQGRASEWPQRRRLAARLEVCDPVWLEQVAACLEHVAAYYAGTRRERHVRAAIRILRQHNAIALKNPPS